MNHPKGLTVDDRGNIYIADTMNMAIRKISDEGIFNLFKNEVNAIYLNQSTAILKDTTASLC